MSLGTENTFEWGMSEEEPEVEVEADQKAVVAADHRSRRSHRPRTGTECITEGRDRNRTLHENKHSARKRHAEDEQNRLSVQDGRRDPARRTSHKTHLSLAGKTLEKSFKVTS